MAYAVYSFYTGTYKGTAIAQADFDRLALRASEVIDQLTYDRTAAVVTAATDTVTIARVQMATCAVAEELQKLEESGGAVSQESIGRYSVTYLNKDSESRRLAKLAKRYLWPTYLMFPGFNDDEM